MARRTATVIIEPHLLVREALESLIKNYRYRVVSSVGSTAEINPAMAGEGPKLVILGGVESTDHAVTEAVSIRKLWADTKIVLLFEHASVTDFQKLLASEVDGCVPLFASPETLVRTLDLVTIEDARVVVTASTKHPAIRPAPKDNSRQSQLEAERLPAAGTESDTKSVTVVPIHPTRQTVNGYSVSRRSNLEGDPQWVPALQHHPRLSEREAQILDGLVRGHANKVIARSCDITEATVKVHMKSILRKIQVANRTQAAVWALEHGHSIDPVKDAC